MAKKRNKAATAQPLYADLELYGIAIAGIPVKGNPYLINLIYSPVAVSYKDQKNFKILKDLCLELLCDTRSIKSVLDCFSQLTEGIGRIVSLQHRALENYGLPYRCVPLHVGQDSRRDIISKLMLLLNKLENPKLEDDLRTYFAVVVASITRGVEEFESAKKKIGFQAQGLADHYSNTLNKFAHLMLECSIVWGNYGHIPEPEEDQQKPVDIKIISLRRPFEQGNVAAHKELYRLARRMGRRWGHQNSSEVDVVFSLGGPPGYKNDKVMQDRLPRHGSFLYWDSAFRQAFYEGYRLAYEGRYTHSVKQALDPAKPFFTDPDADLIRDELKIVDKRRPVGWHRDSPQWRMKIALVANRASASLRRIWVLNDLKACMETYMKGGDGRVAMLMAIPGNTLQTSSQEQEYRSRNSYLKEAQQLFDTLGDSSSPTADGEKGVVLELNLMLRKLSVTGDSLNVLYKEGMRPPLSPTATYDFRSMRELVQDEIVHRLVHSRGIEPEVARNLTSGLVEQFESYRRSWGKALIP